MREREARSIYLRLIDFGYSYLRSATLSLIRYRRLQLTNVIFNCAPAANAFWAAEILI
jgi:hypothetical protein